MENSNNKLQTLIANYIQEIDRNSTLETSQQEEITDHLYSESIALMKHALSVEEAFTIAKMRFGSGNEISNEYSKVNGLSMIFRIAQHTILGLLIWKFITFLCALPVYVYLFFNNAMLGSYQTRILISLFTLIFVLFGLFRAAKNFDMTPLISSLSSKWYLSLILVFVWFLNKSFLFIFQGTSSMMLVGDILTSLFYSSAVIGLALCSLVVLHILFKNKKNKVVEA